MTSSFQLLDHIPNEELRRRVLLIYKKPNLEEDEKQCLQQVLNLIQNLDSMSNDSISSDEPISLEIVSSFLIQNRDLFDRLNGTWGFVIPIQLI